MVEIAVYRYHKSHYCILAVLGLISIKQCLTVVSGQVRKLHAGIIICCQRCLVPFCLFNKPAFIMDIGRCRRKPFVSACKSGYKSAVNSCINRKILMLHFPGKIATSFGLFQYFIKGRPHKVLVFQDNTV